MGWFSDTSNHLPLATGPYVPAMVDVMLGYTKGSSFIRLYYPTIDEPNKKQNSNSWMNWLPDESYLNGLSRVLMLYHFFMKFVVWWFDNPKIPAIYGATTKTNSKLKCVVMSHGLGGSRFLYSNVCCELASRGFLVAAVEHRDRSACNTFCYLTKSDAEIDKRTEIHFQRVKLGKEHHIIRNQQLKARSNECCQIIDFLKDLNEGIVPPNILDDSPLHKDKGFDFNMQDLVGKLDIDNLIIMGHSFGAATSLYTLSRRPDIKLGVLLDPWMFPVKNENLEDKVTQPMLFINTQTFHISINVEAMAILLNNPTRKMYTIKHTTHETQTDSVLIFGYWLNWFMKKIDPLMALRINNALILSFFNEQINFPSDVEDCKELLQREVENIEEGLTKPWA